MAAPTSGRRDSRIHLQLRHSDALQEQEAFRRKYLLVNKHITKLNAGLNLRVEELNAQITQLNSENIGLRSKVIELTRKLAAEQASTRRTAAEAENVAANAIRQLASLRDAFANMASPLAIQPPQLPSLTPREPVARTVLAKKPEISFIREASQEVEDVPAPSHHILHTKEEDETPSPPGPAAFITARRTSRRVTSMFSSDNLPPAPPLSRAPEPLAMSSEEEVESELETPPSVLVRSAAIGKTKAMSSLARQKSPEADDPIPAVGSTRRRVANKENDMDALREESGEETNRTSTVRRAIRRRAVTPPPPPAPESSDTPVPPSRMMTMHQQDADLDSQGEGLRERRTRKSVNYAEPKLNTKMRKPEGYGEGRVKPRSSSSAKEVTPPVSTASSKTPSTSSARKSSATVTPAPPLPLSSDVEEEAEVPRAKARRHSMAV